MRTEKEVLEILEYFLYSCEMVLMVKEAFEICIWSKSHKAFNNLLNSHNIYHEVKL